MLPLDRIAHEAPLRFQDGHIMCPLVIETERADKRLNHIRKGRGPVSERLLNIRFWSMVACGSDEGRLQSFAGHALARSPFDSEY